MLKFLLDEDTHGGLADAFRRRTRLGELPAVDVVRVAQPNGPPKGIQDPELLIWAEEQERIIVSNDRSTLAAHFLDHLNAGRHSPGLLFVKRGTSFAQVIEALVLIAEVGTADDFRDQWHYIPL